MDHYAIFQTEDFVLDIAFQQWVLAPNATSEQVWSAFMQQHPVQRETIEEARLILLALRVREEEITDAQLQRSLQHLHQAMLPVRQMPRPSRNPWQPWGRVAAAVALLFLASGIWWKMARRPDDTIRTAYGEVKTVTLPDRSVVTLNANSTLVIPSDWGSEKPREVYLTGEAFFHVRKLPGHAAHASFIVHTDDLAIAVLGTKFNVKKRRGSTRVVLASGKVRLDLSEKPSGAPILMQPGQLVEFSKVQQRLTKQSVDPALHSAWKNHKLILNNTTMAQVAQVIEETYGLKVEFENAEIPRMVLNGTSLPTDEATVLLHAISTTLDIQAVRKADRIIFKK